MTMKAAAFTLALLLGGTAIAQTTTDTDATTPDATVSTDATSTGTTDATDTSTTATTDTSGQWSNTSTTGTTTMASNMAGGMTVAPDNSNPRRDARGIRVISAPAVAPAGYNGTMSTNTGMGGPLLDASGQAVAAGGDMPSCSRTVTDHCVQTYERSRRR
jgi:hypothetical protein